jgi:maleate isomerase
MINDRMGWRGKVGLILPSMQTVTEPIYYRIAPIGVAFFTSRVLVPGSVITYHADMEREAFRAGRELATAGVDCIAYCCTGSGVLMGIEGDKEFCLRMERETGIPTTSTLSSVLEGLEMLRLKKLVIINPYGEAMHTAEEKFFQANGFYIVRSQSMGIDPAIKFALVTPSEIYRFCRESWDENAEGLFISCMNFNAMPCIGSLERDLRKPVLSSHSATLWKVLRMVGVREPILGFGRLLEEGL